jgi:hypothetical protein
MENCHSLSAKRQSHTAHTSLVTLLAPLILCLCLIVLFFGVWKHVMGSEQPPFGDSIAYMQKAKVFWEMVASGHWKNPLNLEPAFRPPGTILMSYPFGFTEDFKGYLARSVILPILGFVAALYVATCRGRMSISEHLDLAAVALIIATLPCFFHFEAGVTIVPVYWGLVDNFFAAVAALALAIGYRSVSKRSWYLLLFSSFTIGFCLMIKPAGTIVATTVILVLSAVMVANGLLASGDKLSWRQALRSIFSLRMFSFLVTLSLGTGFFLVASLRSEYMSPAMLQYGNTAMKILRESFVTAFSVTNFKIMLYPSFGLNVVPLGFIAAIGIIRTSLEGARLGGLSWTITRLLNPLLAAVVLAVGAFFWLGYTGVSQVRYFYPFAFVSLLLVAIFLLDSLRGSAAPYARTFIYGSAIILFGNLTLMLYLPNTPGSWQRIFGVNLESSSGGEGKRLAGLLLRQARGAQRDLNVYALGTGEYGPITCWGETEKVLHPTEPTFNTAWPVDWRRVPVFRLENLFLSDYILYHPVTDAANWTISHPTLKIGDLWQEVETISSWLTNANQQCGLNDLVFGQFAIKEVVSPKLFAQSLAKWAASRHWRDVFEYENSDFLLSSTPAKHGNVITHNSSEELAVTFERLIAIDAVQVETVSPLVLRVSWHAVSEKLPDNLYFFVHVMDDRGNMLSNCQFYLNSRLWVDSSPLVLHHTLVPSYIYVNSPTLRYGFGIFQGSHAERLLTPDPSGTDFGGKRVVREMKLR